MQDQTQTLKLSKKNEKLGLTFVAVTLMFMFLVSWVLGIYRIRLGQTHSLQILLVLAFSSLPLYIFLRNSKSNFLSWKFLATGLFCFQLLSHSAMQTDQLRYIHDGLQSLRGTNPFLYAPREAFQINKIEKDKESKKSIEGIKNTEKIVENETNKNILQNLQENINHPHLPTVYLPLAQIVFAISGILNPFLWPEIPIFSRVNHFFDGKLFFGIFRIQNLFSASVYWHFEFGLRIFYGICTVLLVYILRNKNAHLLVLHPLYLFSACLNLHLDGLCVLCIASLFSRQNFFGKNEDFSLVSLLLLRGLALPMLPFYFVKWAKNFGKTESIKKLFFIASICFFAFALYWSGSHGRMFQSTGAYIKHWMFFGYLHRWSADFASFFTSNNILFAKIFCGAVFCLLYGFIFKLFLKRRVSLRLSFAFVYLFFLVCTSTLHPWYLLPLLALGLPYLKVLNIFWCWPLLSLLSYTFYFSQNDPFLIRNIVYCGVSLILFFDVKAVLRKRGLVNVAQS